MRWRDDTRRMLLICATIMDCRFDSTITLESNNRRINAKSIMGIMAFNPSEGMSVDIVTEGSDEQEALLAIEKFLVCE